MCLALSATNSSGKPLPKSSFFVSGETKKSIVSKSSLKHWKLQVEGEVVELVIEGRRHKFLVSKVEDENVLGLDFLRDHKVITQCNYRP